MKKKLLFGQHYYSDKTLDFYKTIIVEYKRKEEYLNQLSIDKVKIKKMKIDNLINLKEREIKILNMLWTDAMNSFKDKERLLHIKNNLNYRKAKLNAKIQYLKKMKHIGSVK